VECVPLAFFYSNGWLCIAVLDPLINAVLLPVEHVKSQGPTGSCAASLLVNQAQHGASCFSHFVILCSVEYKHPNVEPYVWVLSLTVVATFFHNHHTLFQSSSVQLALLWFYDIRRLRKITYLPPLLKVCRYCPVLSITWYTFLEISRDSTFLSWNKHLNSC